MSSSAGRANFPGHFSSSPSPPASPSLQPKDMRTKKEKGLQTPHAAAVDPDFNLPGAYPPSPLMPQSRPEGVQAGSGVDPGVGDSMRGAMQRLPSGDADATRRQRSEESGGTQSAKLGKDSGCEDSSLAEAERSIGNLDLNKDGERDTAKQTNHSDCETPGEDSASDEDSEDSHLANIRPRPPTRIDLHATSPAPKLPTRSPLRSGFRTRARGESASSGADADVGESENQESHPDASNEDDHRPDENTTDEQEHAPKDGAHRTAERSDKPSPKSKSKSSPQPQPQPQPQPTLNATPTHAHVKDGAGVSIDGPVGMLRAPGIEDRMADGRDARDAQDTDRLDQDQEAAAAHDHDHNRNQDQGHDRDNPDSASTDSFIDVRRGEHHPLSSSSSTGKDLSPSASSDEDHEHAGHAGPGAIAGAGGGGKDIDGKQKSGGLISKMRRTLSKATNGGGKHVS